MLGLGLGTWVGWLVRVRVSSRILPPLGAPWALSFPPIRPIWYHSPVSCPTRAKEDGGDVVMEMVMVVVVDLDLHLSSMLHVVSTCITSRTASHGKISKTTSERAETSCTLKS